MIRINGASNHVIAQIKKTYEVISIHYTFLIYRLTSAVMVENLSLEDGQEGIKAFIEKRKPTWSHRNQKVH